MEISIYDIIDNEFGTTEVVNKILKKLKEKYNKDFEILKIGERYGTDISNEVTVMCTIKNFNDFIFKVKYDMVEEIIVEDNFYIRYLCYLIEDKITEILKLNNTKTLVKVELARKNKIEKLYKKVEDFIEENPNDFFIATIVIEKNKFEYISECLSLLTSIYINLKLNILLYEMNQNEFKNFYNKSKNLDNIPMSYIETFNFENRKIGKIENGMIKF